MVRPLVMMVLMADGFTPRSEAERLGYMIGQTFGVACCCLFVVGAVGGLIYLLTRKPEPPPAPPPPPPPAA
jgi:hypothetical protein